MANVMKYYNGTSWIPVASQYIDPNYAYLKAYDNPSNRNLLYNGAMQVAQRATSVANITTTNFYTADRWNFGITTLGTWTQSIESDGPTGSGIAKSLKLLCTTAQASPASGAFAYLFQRIEGQDLQKIAKGTAYAQQLTLSFRVKGSTTGTYIAQLYDYQNNRSISASYTISSTATWEKKTITFSSDATGVFLNNNDIGLEIEFWLGAGSTFNSGTLGTGWATQVAANRAVGQTNLASSTNNYIQITGVQLEIGPVATPFEFKNYGQELRECQRYYYKTLPGSANGSFGAGFAYTTVNAVHFMNFPTEMRIVPTAIETSGTAADYRITNGAAGVIACSAIPTFSSASKTSSEISTTVASGLTVGQGSLLRASGANGYLAWSAEL